MTKARVHMLSSDKLGVGVSSTRQTLRISPPTAKFINQAYKYLSNGKFKEIIECFHFLTSKDHRSY